MTLIDDLEKRKANLRKVIAYRQSFAFVKNQTPAEKRETGQFVKALEGVVEALGKLKAVEVDNDNQEVR